MQRSLYDFPTIDGFDGPLCRRENMESREKEQREDREGWEGLHLEEK